MTEEFLTPDEARRRFGRLMSDGWPSQYLEFEEETCTWKPQFDDCFNLLGYWRNPK